MEINNRNKLSWFGLLQDSVNNLPGPSWVWYVLLWLLLVGIAIIIQGFSAGFSDLSIEPITLLVIFQLCYVLFLMDFLDNQAIEILEGFSPKLKSSSVTESFLKDKFIYLSPTIVNRITFITALFFSVIAFSIFNESPSGQFQSAAEVSFSNSTLGYYQFIIFCIMWFFNIIFIYHTIRQIKALNFVFTNCMEINIFHQTGLYSFSKLGASTAIGLVLSTPIWLLLDPGIISLVINIVYSIGAIFIFLFPLVGIHNLLVEQKSDLLSKSQLNKEKIILEFYSQIENNHFSNVAEFETALAALGSAHQEIKTISTWPWDNETIRRLSGAILLPITIWLIQFFLSKLLSV